MTRLVQFEDVWMVHHHISIKPLAPGVFTDLLLIVDIISLLCECVCAAEIDGREKSVASNFCVL